MPCSVVAAADARTYCGLLRHTWRPHRVRADANAFFDSGHNSIRTGAACRTSSDVLAPRTRCQCGCVICGHGIQSAFSRVMHAPAANGAAARKQHCCTHTTAVSTRAHWRTRPRRGCVLEQAGSKFPNINSWHGRYSALPATVSEEQHHAIVDAVTPSGPPCANEERKTLYHKRRARHALPSARANLSPPTHPPTQNDFARRATFSATRLRAR